MGQSSTFCHLKITSSKCKGMVWLDYILVLLASVHLCSAIPFERAGSAFIVNFDADTTTFAFDVAADSAVVVTTEQTTEQTTATTDTNTATGSAFITDVTDTTFQATTDTASSTGTTTEQVTTTTTTTTSTTTTVCEVGCGTWTEEGSKCFEIFTDSSKFSAAQTSCEGYGGDLAQIESQEDQDAVFGLAGGTSTWIGANDIDKHKKWVWYNGGKINKNTYRNWRKNRPTTKKNRDCARMNNNGKWDDTKCSTSLQYACQKDPETCGITTTTTTTTTTTSTTTTTTTTPTSTTTTT